MFLYGTPALKFKRSMKKVLFILASRLIAAELADLSVGPCEGSIPMRPLPRDACVYVCVRQGRSSSVYSLNNVVFLLFYHHYHAPFPSEV